MATKDEEAHDLAQRHYEVEAGMTGIFRLTAAADVETLPSEPIKLLEVNEHTIAAGIMPLRFGPAPASGISHSSVILEITPEEFDKVQRRQLLLPNGWTLGERIPRPPETNTARLIDSTNPVS